VKNESGAQLDVEAFRSSYQISSNENGVAIRTPSVIGEAQVGVDCDTYSEYTLMMKESES
jgi:hypothetical protein